MGRKKVIKWLVDLALDRLRAAWRGDPIAIALILGILLILGYIAYRFATRSRAERELDPDPNRPPPPEDRWTAPDADEVARVVGRHPDGRPGTGP